MCLRENYQLTAAPVSKHECKEILSPRILHSQTSGLQSPCERRFSPKWSRCEEYPLPDRPPQPWWCRPLCWRPSSTAALCGAVVWLFNTTTIHVHVMYRRMDERIIKTFRFCSDTGWIHSHCTTRCTSTLAGGARPLLAVHWYTPAWARVTSWMVRRPDSSSCVVSPISTSSSPYREEIEREWEKKCRNSSKHTSIFAGESLSLSAVWEQGR